MESWRNNRFLFWLLTLPGAVWLTLFFVAPLSVLWVYSFGSKSGITEIEITGTALNYLRAVDPVYFQIMWKSIWISAIATFVCLILAYPIAFAICF